MPSKTMSPMSNREIRRLLKDWGFEEAGFMGGHQIMEYEGRQVHITAPGRSTPTPYRALRKAAAVMGVSLRDFLRGPGVRTVDKRRRPVGVPVETGPDVLAHVAVVESTDGSVIAELTTPIQWTCSTCGKDDFVTERGFKGHLRGHEFVTCEKCNREVSRLGLGPHRKFCTPALPENDEEEFMAASVPKFKRSTRGRPRHPIAEVPEKGRGRGRSGLDLEVPELDDVFPEPGAFTQPSEPVVDPMPQMQSMLGTDVTPDVAQAFTNWVEATRELLARIDSMRQDG